MRRVGAVVFLVLGLGMVSGCSPAHLTLVAVANGKDGRPVAVLQPCDEDETIWYMRLESRPTGPSGAGPSGAGTDRPGPSGAGSSGAGTDGPGSSGAAADAAATDGAAADAAATDGAGEDAAATDGAGEDRVPVDDGGWEAPRETTLRGRAVFPVLSPPSAWHVEGCGGRELLPGRTYSLSFYAYDSAYYGDGYFTADDLASLRPGQVWAAGRAMSVDDFAHHVHEVC
jgi:hypothetical protein